MSFKDFYKGRRSFVDDNSVVDIVKRSKRFNSSTEDLTKAKRVQLLDTSNQRTYLVATNKNIYKILDDRRSDRAKIAWSRAKKSLVSDGNLGVTIRAYKPRTDKLVLNKLPEKTNLISKNLFVNIDATMAVNKLIDD